MLIESRARYLRSHPNPPIEDIRKHARDRDAFIAESRKLGVPVHDFAAISALPGPAVWYERSERSERPWSRRVG